MGLLHSAGRGEHYGDPRRSLVDAQYAVYEASRLGDTYHVLGSVASAHEVAGGLDVVSTMQPVEVSPSAFPAGGEFDTFDGVNVVASRP